MYDYNKVDDFNIDINAFFVAIGKPVPAVKKEMLNILFDQANPRNSTAPTEFGVYAMYLGSTSLKKIGKGTEKVRKLRHRMSLYGHSTDPNITSNYSSIQVKYVEVSSSDEAWALERYCQGMACSRKESMDWENRSRN
jgi:hypothetical protein